MKRKILGILLIGCALFIHAQTSLDTPLPTLNYQLSTINLESIILDIYNATSEFSEVDFEQLQTDLLAIHDAPIDLNHTTDEELSRLYFLSPRQIDDILFYADKHPFESLYELLLIPSLADYEIRDLLPFVTINNDQSPFTNNNKMYAREVFTRAKHEIITRIDARNIESFSGSDPVYLQTRYRFDFQRRVIFGAQFRRPAGGTAQDLQYGAYLQLRDIGHLHTLVAGNFQASFGQGLVFAPVFHAGKSMYVTSIGQTREGLRYYSSVDGASLHGVGATFRWQWNKATRLDISALYSMTHANDTAWRHILGANLTLRHKRLDIQLTAAQTLWSDSIHPYNNAAYNHHYFRGSHQAVLGASFRYNHGWFDLFGELATTENYEHPSLQGGAGGRLPHWGFAALIGSRFYPADGISLIAIYRYYSPFFDNPLGYAFSETSRINDENGGYIGWDITRLRNWRFTGYADIFYFSGIKYGIPTSPSLGYDLMFEPQYIRQSWRVSLRLRARKKGTLSTYSARAMFDCQTGPWSFRTTADANITHQTSYGLSLAQDIAYDFQSPASPVALPLSLRLRLQAFDAREWDNRIYLYEHDVLYAFSIPATYGLGGRAYLCLKWQAHPHIALYFRFSETVYARQWYLDKHPGSPFAANPSQLPTRTDFHLLLRSTL